MDTKRLPDFDLDLCPNFRSPEKMESTVLPVHAPMLMADITKNASSVFQGVGSRREAQSKRTFLPILVRIGMHGKARFIEMRNDGGWTVEWMERWVDG